MRKPTSCKKLEILPNTNISTTYYIARSLSENIAMTKKVKVANSITKRRVSELIPVLGSQPAGEAS